MSTDTAARRIDWEDVRLPSWVIGGAGIVGVIALWWILAETVFANVGAGVRAIPTPPQVIEGFVQSGWDFYARNFSVTLAEAGIGYLWGNGLALLFAALVLIAPRLEGVVMQLAIITYCIPIVAVGILLVVIVPVPGAGEPAGNAIFLAALSVFFTTVVGALLGLKAADRSALDLVTVYGGTRFTQLRKVRVVAALPAILNALQIAVPAAFLGAVLGEFLGRVSTGVGPAMIAAQQGLDSPRVWGLALVSGLVALAGFGVLGLIARVIAPWSKGVSA
ncbi:ABC transporter permease [Microbacterium amylolyticum]|uniref:ABC-type nitrate/sulfonate/bicarbonate transport system permease component n=1 Tax=Microbacterium amylolyticum TaxID=936337 RepID=A0ABS4ZHI2_9MICO|nr:ABC transporter permease subunit [Microbacterium amylolyticum]MBP2436463.1 ABC-type nitrate/sulfonate/bicarbonate transport system permease component [Microbacterium amylolyticum]